MLCCVVGKQLCVCVFSLQARLSINNVRGSTVSRSVLVLVAGGAGGVGGCAATPYPATALNEVVLRFHKTKIVRIKASGDFQLTSGGWRTATTGEGGGAAAAAGVPKQAVGRRCFVVFCGCPSSLDSPSARLCQVPM